MGNFVNLLDIIYPIGSIYLSTVNKSPANIIGGTWKQHAGEVLRAESNCSITGSDNHTLAINQIPAHAHGLNGYTIHWGYQQKGVARFLADGHISVFADNSYTTNHTGVYAVTNASYSSGEGQPFSKLPKCFNLYCWERIA